MPFIVFDVDGTLEISNGPIPIKRLKQLKTFGCNVLIVGNYGKIVQKNLDKEFPNGNPNGLPKHEALKNISGDYLCIYVGDTESDREAAQEAGWCFIYADNFR